MSSKLWFRASLIVSSELMKLEDIVASIGLDPTDSIELGAPLSSRDLKSPLAKEAVWILESGSDEKASFDDQIQAIKHLLGNRCAKVAALVPRAFVRFSFLANLERKPDYLALSDSSIAFISSLKAGVLFEVYPAESE